MASATNEIDEIRRRMAQIRMELHEDVQGVVAGTEAAFDWQYYVRLYPWAALAGALVAGYLIVPKKRAAQAVDMNGALPKHVPRHEVKEEKQKARRKSGLLGLALGFVGPIIVRAAQNYASNYVEHWIQQQQPIASPPMAPGPGTPPGRGPGGPYPA